MNPRVDLCGAAGVRPGLRPKGAASWWRVVACAGEERVLEAVAGDRCGPSVDGLAVWRRRVVPGWVEAGTAGRRVLWDGRCGCREWIPDRGCSNVRLREAGTLHGDGTGERVRARRGTIHPSMIQVGRVLEL